MIIKSVGVLSVAKVSGVLYGLMGVIIGAIFSLISLVGAAFSSGGDEIFGFMFGIGSIIILPIFYGFIGFIGGAISAAIYNFIVAFVGGIEIEFESQPSPAPPTSA